MFKESPKKVRNCECKFTFYLLYNEGVIVIFYAFEIKELSLRKNTENNR